MFRGVVKEELKVPATVDYLSELRDFATRLGRKHGVSEKVVNAFRLSIDEASTNIIRHAYRDSQGMITVRVIIKRSTMTVVLIDQGRFFDPRVVKDPDLKRYVTIGKKGGLGIFMMRKLMDQIDYRKTEEGNELRLTKAREDDRAFLKFRLPSFNASIKWRFYILSTSIITVGVLGAYGYLFFAQSSKFTGRILGQGKLNCRKLANIPDIQSGIQEVVGWMRINPNIESYLQESESYVHDAFVVDLDRQIYSPDTSRFLSQYSFPANAEEIEANVHLFVDEHGQSLYDVSEPIKVGEPPESTTVGHAHLIIKKAYIDALVSRQRMAYLRLALLGLVGAYVGIGILLTLVMMPFQRLSQWVNSLGHEGQLEDDVDLDASSEIGDIAKAFSDITTKFRKSQENLAQQERLQREMQVAQEIQQTLLPDECPEIKGYAIDGLYEAAAQVGGDYYDFVEVDKDTVGIVVADVSGKGVPGSLVMTMIRTALRTEARGVHSAAEVLCRVNDFVIDDMKKGMFVTVFYAIVDARRRRINYASAGHNPMILYRGATKKTYYLNPKGFPIGIALPDPKLFRESIESDTIQLAEDDILLIYTDGITEAMNQGRELFGEERLLQAVRKEGGLTAEKFVQMLRSEIHSFTEGFPQNDDITLVAIKEETTAEKEELRRAKEAHRLITEGLTIKEACETAGLTSYAYYNKYKEKFEQNAIEDLEVEEAVSVEAKHLSIEEKTKIYDIIVKHPEYGPRRIAEELNTVTYGFTVINESRIYEELLRSRLNTRPLREAYVARGGKKRKIKSPGTPMLTIEGEVIIQKGIAPVAPEIMRPPEAASPPRSPEPIQPRPLPVVPPPLSPEPAREKRSVEEIDEHELLAQPIEDLIGKEQAAAATTDDLPTDRIEDQAATPPGAEAELTGQAFIEELEPPDEIGAGADDLDTAETTMDDAEVAAMFEDQTDDIGLEELEARIGDLDDDEQLSEMSLSDLLENDDEGSRSLEEKILSSAAEELLTGGLSEVAEDEVESDGFPATEEALSSLGGEAEISSGEEFSSAEIRAEEDDEEVPPALELVSQGGDGYEADVLEEKPEEAYGEAVISKETSAILASAGRDEANAGAGSDAPDHPMIIPGDLERDRQRAARRGKLQLLKTGLSFYKESDYDAAIAVLREVTDEYPDYKEAHIALGNAFFRNGMYDAALKEYHRVKDLDPSEADAYENIGVIYANHGRFDEAILEWEKILELQPDRADIKGNIAKLRRVMNADTFVGRES